MVWLGPGAVIASLQLRPRRCRDSGTRSLRHMGGVRETPICARNARVPAGRRPLQASPPDSQAHRSFPLGRGVFHDRIAHAVGQFAEPDSRIARCRSSPGAQAGASAARAKSDAREGNIEPRSLMPGRTIDRIRVLLFGTRNIGPSGGGYSKTRYCCSYDSP